MSPLPLLRDTLILLAFFAILVGFFIAGADAIPQHYSAGVTMP